MLTPLLVILFTTTTPPAANTTGTSTRTVTAPSVSEKSPSAKTVDKPSVGSQPHTSTATGPSQANQPKETLAPQDPATKLGIELEKWGKLNVEGLSRRAVTWIVIIVIAAVIAAAILALYIADNSRSTAAPIGGALVLASVAGVAAFLFLRAQLAPVRDVSETAVSTRRVLNDMLEAANRQQSQIQYLESRITELNGQLAAVPALQASLLVERERLKERERDLAEAAVEVNTLHADLKEARALLDRQAKEIVWLQNGRLLIWTICLVALVWIAAGYRARAWRARAEFEREMRMR